MSHPPVKALRVRVLLVVEDNTVRYRDLDAHFVQFVLDTAEHLTFYRPPLARLGLDDEFHAESRILKVVDTAHLGLSDCVRSEFQFIVRDTDTE
jgi:hypothetical protein